MTSLWNIDCIPCWLSYLLLGLLFGRALPEAAWVTFTSRRPRQRVSWPQRKAGKKGRTLGRPQSIGVFLPAQRQPSSSPGSQAAVRRVSNTTVQLGLCRPRGKELQSQCGELGQSALEASGLPRWEGHNHHKPGSGGCACWPRRALYSLPSILGLKPGPCYAKQLMGPSGGDELWSQAGQCDILEQAVTPPLVSVTMSVEWG